MNYIFKFFLEKLRLRIERHELHWCLWVYANKDYTLGTAYNLYDNGCISLHIIRINSEDEIILRKDK